jgi:NADPH-dependent 2,4-dienoyl-CoA reductase/sulfur reductase-like enzyme
VGLEAAEYLCAKGCKVTIVEMLDEIGADLGDIRKVSVLGNIHGACIDVKTKTKVIEITGNAVRVEHEGQTEDLACDYAVIAVGAKPRDGKDLEEACKRLGIDWYVIGDALEARRAINAIYEANEVARAI